MRTAHAGQVTAIALALALAACVSSKTPNAPVMPDSLPSSPTRQASTPVPTSSLMASPAPSASPTPNPRQPSPTPSAITLARCTNESGSYAVAYPSDWFSNAGLPGVVDCTLFAPQPFQAASDPGIAIELAVQPNVPDPFGPITASFYGISILVDEEIIVDGRRAWMREMEVTEPDADALFGVGDRYTHYFIDLGGGRHLWARTATAEENYDAVKAVLAQMMQSLKVASS